MLCNKIIFSLHAADPNDVIYWKTKISNDHISIKSDLSVSRLSLSENRESIKLVVVGCGAVGKTCSLIRYCTNDFPTDYIPTVFDNYSLNVNFNGILLSVSLWDVSGGGEDYDRLRPLSYPQTDVFMLIFSISSPTSYANIMVKWWPEVTHHVPEARIVLVANKIDFRKNEEAKESLRQKGLTLTTTEQGEQRAKEINASGFIEMSALTGENVDAAFGLCYKIALSEQQGMPRKKKEKCVMQ